MNQTIKELYERKSVRAFEERGIEPEKKEAILGAAIQAASAGNMALYSILDITDQKLKDTLAVTCDNQPFIAKAPLVLVFLADYSRWYDLFCSCEETVRKPGIGDMMLAVSDTLIAAQTAVTAAWSLGIGSCYIGDIMERFETHRELFHLPQYAVPVAMAVFGYPTKQQAERKKPERPEIKNLVFENTYHRTTPEEYAACLGKQHGLSGGALESWIHAFCKRKWNCEFSEEMSRSVEAMRRTWVGEGGAEGDGC